MRMDPTGLTLQWHFLMGLPVEFVNNIPHVDSFHWISEFRAPPIIAELWRHKTCVYRTGWSVFVSGTHVTLRIRVRDTCYLKNSCQGHVLSRHFMYIRVRDTCYLENSCTFVSGTRGTLRIRAHSCPGHILWHGVHLCPRNMLSSDFSLVIFRSSKQMVRYYVH
jgi:hypothetical protein